jgi:hypothetical protein
MAGSGNDSPAGLFFCRDCLLAAGGAQPLPTFRLDQASRVGKG